MPYQFKNDNELNELIAAVKAKNAKGEGLNNEEIQLGLHSIALMLQKTADSIETKPGARELNEFKMELEGTAKSLEALRDPAILEDPGKFEDALADLVNLKDLLLKRTHNGRLYYDGGLSDPIPVKKAFADGCDKLVVILTRPKNYYRSPSKDIKASWLIISCVVCETTTKE